MDKLDEQKIQRILRANLISSPAYVMENLYVFRWESDLLLKTKSGYYYECEIKTSVSDFKHDFVKEDKHHILQTGERVDTWYKFGHNGERIPVTETKKVRRPNYFYYAVSEDIAQKVIEQNLVPEYAGLIVVSPFDRSVYSAMRIEKKAPLLHKDKYTDEELKLCEKFYYNWRNEVNLRLNRGSEIDRLRYELHVIKEEFKAETGHDFRDNL